MEKKCFCAATCMQHFMLMHCILVQCPCDKSLFLHQNQVFHIDHVKSQGVMIGCFRLRLDCYEGSWCYAAPNKFIL